VGTLDLRNELIAIVGTDAVTISPAHHPDDLHDESLHPDHNEPFAVVRPLNTRQVSDIAKTANSHGVPITPRGSGTGLSGAATPVPGGIVVSFSRMNQLLRLDANDHVAVVQPGITLRELGEALASSGLRYPVYPGELSGSLGGNVNTNAGGMRAVRHGVTRNHVLGLELVLIDGTVVRTGGPVVKSSSGYDLTQLVVGSEGTLAMVCEVTLKLSPIMAHSTTVLVPFRSLDNVTRIVPRIVASGLEPSMLEYLDVLTMSAITKAAELELGVDSVVASETAAYLIIVLETRTAQQLDDDIAALAELVEGAGALAPFGSARPPEQTRSSTSWYPARACPCSSPRRPPLPSVTTRSSPVAATSATVIFTSRCSCPTTNEGPPCCSSSSRMVWASAGRYRENTVLAATSKHRTSPSPTPR
jgi:glycolate oxidase